MSELQLALEPKHGRGNRKRKVNLLTHFVDLRLNLI